MRRPSSRSVYCIVVDRSKVCTQIRVESLLCDPTARSPFVKLSVDVRVEGTRIGERKRDKSSWGILTLIATKFNGIFTVPYYTLSRQNEDTHTHTRPHQYNIWVSEWVYEEVLLCMYNSELRTIASGGSKIFFVVGGREAICKKKNTFIVGDYWLV